MLQALKELNALAIDLGVSLLTLSLAWTAANPHISTTIVGSRTREQLLMNHQAASYELTPDVVLRLNEITEPVLRKLGSNADYYESLESSRIY
jgi:aryl-alcohol dehydrogenase-like predicted oxidoreductase